MILPSKLQQGDEIRVVTLSKSLGSITLNHAEIVKRKLATLGLSVSFGANSIEVDEDGSLSVLQRVEDLHSAFLDKNVKAIFVARGGYNCNQILPFLDFDLISQNPKIIIGYSDITAVINAIYAKTGLVTYSGPGFTSLKDVIFEESDFTYKYWHKALFEGGETQISSATTIFDECYQGDHTVKSNYESSGFWVINQGLAQGEIIGSNLCTLNLLQGTDFMPDISDKIIFIEDDNESKSGNFDRDLESLTQLKNFENVRGLVVGVFQKDSEIDRQELTKIIKNKVCLDNIPVLANVNFGHTKPILTFPIGMKAYLNLESNKAKLTINF